ncbi:GCN5 family N-acetyltransferase [Amylibacter marinus]|uniref:GCN5 family N-acetyltransferase n=1 Tax=Amylibacter marinus TaxID=1475483 RepID=A0ABQ5VTZ6_9RHOB|nr:GNAT family protein [Amylibacter marinus]GLQ34913.1 GCN5 family N-acetyltransferase [Amylibacter marinus]
MFGRGTRLELQSPRCILRLPVAKDHAQWVHLRQNSAEFLRGWEPVWAPDHFSKSAFQNRVFWAKKTFDEGDGLPLFIVERDSKHLLGAITLDNIRRGPAQAATLGYWIGQDYARMGYMSEAINAIVAYAFSKLDLSRIEAATLPENKPSRGLLEKSGFKYEGVAQSYLQIAGRWRTHVLYANIRMDRRGKTDAGVIGG